MSGRLPHAKAEIVIIVISISHFFVRGKGAFPKIRSSHTIENDSDQVLSAMIADDYRHSFDRITSSHLIGNAFETTQLRNPAHPAH